jgi:drug/metabolite transporter (DMT)-like permease
MSFAALLGLVLMVVLFSTIAPATKYVFQTSQITPMTLTFGRVATGFLFILLITLVCDWRGLSALSWSDVFRLTSLGWLGVLPYVAAAWSLQYTSVSHYTVIYSLLPVVTALIHIGLYKELPRLSVFMGIACAAVGCLIAISDRFSTAKGPFLWGDGLALLYTIMMAANVTWSSRMAKHHGVLTANTVMFGSTMLVLLPFTGADRSAVAGVSYEALGWMSYVGMATVIAFALRYWSLRIVPPTTVAAYHNLIPLCTLMLAHVVLGEGLGRRVMIGAALILIGIHLTQGRGPLQLVARRRNVTGRPSVQEPRPSCSHAA